MIYDGCHGFGRGDAIPAIAKVAAFEVAAEQNGAEGKTKKEPVKEVRAGFLWQNGILAFHISDDLVNCDQKQDANLEDINH